MNEGRIMTIKMPDRSVWSVPVHAILMNRTSYYAQKYGFEEGSKEWDDEWKSCNNVGIIEWAANNMNWEDISELAKKIKSPPPLTPGEKEEGWVNGAKNILDPPPVTMNPAGRIRPNVIVAEDDEDEEDEDECERTPIKQINFIPGVNSIFFGSMMFDEKRKKKFGDLGVNKEGVFEWYQSGWINIGKPDLDTTKEESPESPADVHPNCPYKDNHSPPEKRCIWCEHLSLKDRFFKYINSLSGALSKIESRIKKRREERKAEREAEGSEQDD